MGLLMLGASRGTTITVRTEGDAAEALMEALAALVANRFGEDF
jgi:phosphocarrier protein